MTKPPRPLHLLLDFDGTLTLSSTLPTIASIAIITASTSPSPFPHPALANLSATYLTDLRDYNQSYIPRKNDRRTVEQELAYLASLDGVERASVERVEGSGIFDGVFEGDGDGVRTSDGDGGGDANARLRAKGTQKTINVANQAIRDGTVQLRSGWWEILRKVHEYKHDHDSGRSGKVDIVSVAWSRTFISACLASAAAGVAEDLHRHDDGNVDVEDDGNGDGNGNLNNPTIYANEIIPSPSPSFSSSSRSCPPINGKEKRRRGILDRYFHPQDRGIWTSSDKLEILHRAVSTFKSSKALNANHNIKPKTIYIGDSPTDLGCLLAADMGICIRDEPLSGEQRDLAETLARIGVGCECVDFWVRGSDWEEKLVISGEGVDLKETAEETEEEKDHHLEAGLSGNRRLWWARDFHQIIACGMLDDG